MRKPIIGLLPKVKPRRVDFRRGFGLVGSVALVALASILAAAGLGAAIYSLSATKQYNYSEQAYLSAKSTLETLVSGLNVNDSLSEMLLSVKSGAPVSLALDAGSSRYGELSANATRVSDTDVRLDVSATYNGTLRTASATLRSTASETPADIFTQKLYFSDPDGGFSVGDTGHVSEIKWNTAIVPAYNRVTINWQNAEMRFPYLINIFDGIDRLFFCKPGNILTVEREIVLGPFTSRPRYAYITSTGNKSDILNFVYPCYDSDGYVYIFLDGFKTLNIEDDTLSGAPHIFLIDVSGTLTRINIANSVYTVSAYIYAPAAELIKTGNKNCTLTGSFYVASIPNGNGFPLNRIVFSEPDFDRHGAPPVLNYSAGGSDTEWSVIAYD